MSIHHCPFCNQSMTMEHRITYIDYLCNYNSHFFSKRIVNNIITKIKLRIRDGNSRFYLKINYDEGNMQIWKSFKVNVFKEQESEIWEYKETKRITIEHTFVPDYSDIDALKNKIKTFLVFV